jgi:hypothetical protein
MLAKLLSAETEHAAYGYQAYWDEFFQEINSKIPAIKKGSATTPGSWTGNDPK